MKRRIAMVLSTAGLMVAAVVAGAPPASAASQICQAWRELNVCLDYIPSAAGVNYYLVTGTRTVPLCPGHVPIYAYVKFQDIYGTTRSHYYGGTQCGQGQRYKAWPNHRVWNTTYVVTQVEDFAGTACVWLRPGGRKVTNGACPSW